MGNFMQLLSNDKLKSVEHKVLANHLELRISVASIFTRR
ncbi:1-aminocyclopropane-1-carboxylate oxidase homolog 12 [Linum perenne]